MIFDKHLQNNNNNNNNNTYPYQKWFAKRLAQALLKYKNI